MKPLKFAVALVIKNDKDEFLVVKRPKDEHGPLAGVWGFPALTRLEGESEEDAANRVGQVKLGVRLQIGAKIGERAADRGDYILHLSDYAANVVDGDSPNVPQPDTSITQYTDLKYSSDPDILLPAAQKGSLCSQVYLSSINIDWHKSASFAGD